MEENNTPYLNESQPTVKQPRTFSAFESVFAWLFFAAGYLFCRVFPVTRNPAGGFLFILALFLVTAFMLKRRCFKLFPLLAAGSALVVSLALILSGNGFLHFFAYLYALAAYCYFLSSAGNLTARGFSDLILIDFLKALFVLPFHSFGQLFTAMFSGKAKGSGRFLGRLLLGAAFAFIPTALVLALLSYDSGFSALIAKIFSFDLVDIISHVWSLAFAIPIGMYLFGLYLSAADQKCDHLLTADACKKTASQLRVAPVVTVLAAVVPLLCVYVIFFISQWQYYVSGFTGVLPASFSYAEYAREGFFQLCTVSVINLFVIVAVMLLLRRSSDRPSVLLKLLSILYSVFTLILISTAIAKMVMYIDCYGLTHKRVYAAWLMGVLALVFLLIILRQFLPKLNAVAVSFMACVVLFAGLSMSNVDGLIARYNVNRYVDGSLATVDLEEIAYELGDAGIPELVRLNDILEERIDSGTASSEDQNLYDNLSDILISKATAYASHPRGVFSMTVPYLKAREALRETIANLPGN